ncbi:YihY/virulence factor BrkB family protein [Actinomarinicola tropica]|uniref:YihY family inner membrane protein n=1 Tax=Actinomarinicola tropica TaxID=2789776 RepID=A0A5Q2RKH9_9ACTN|nr:YihY/virulence factor BrkB family protein [Actinomarinicola tropica]QGG95081.1 YihY family inner membrane protein [Actinomarinicola tropica]
MGHDAGGRIDRAIVEDLIHDVQRDNLPLTAAGVAYFGFLSIIPTLIATVSIWGLVGDPARMQRRIDELATALPAGARDLLSSQLDSITATSERALSVGAAISVVVALWVASTGMSHLIGAVNKIHRDTDRRSFVARRWLAIQLTLGAVAFALVALAAITIWPSVVRALGLPSPASTLLRLAVWPVLAACLALGLAVLYHLAPNRQGRWEWWTWGSAVAIAVWTLASIGFQIYAANFASFNETYGSLAAVVVFQTWLWLSAMAVLLGAEVDEARDAQRQREFLLSSPSDDVP